MRTEPLVGMVLGLFSFTLLMLSHFLPMHTYDDGSFEAEATYWGMDGEVTYGFGFGNQPFSQDWHDSDADDSDGIEELRAAGPLLAAGTVLMFAAITWAALTGQLARQGAAAILALLGTLLAGVALMLYQAGINQLDLQFEPTYGFGLMLGAIMLGLATTGALAYPSLQAESE